MIMKNSARKYPIADSGIELDSYFAALFYFHFTFGIHQLKNEIMDTKEMLQKTIGQEENYFISCIIRSILHHWMVDSL